MLDNRLSEGVNFRDEAGSYEGSDCEEETDGTASDAEEWSEDEEDDDERVKSIDSELVLFIRSL